MRACVNACMYAATVKRLRNNITPFRSEPIQGRQLDGFRDPFRNPPNGAESPQAARQHAASMGNAETATGLPSVSVAPVPVQAPKLEITLVV